MMPGASHRRVVDARPCAATKASYTEELGLVLPTGTLEIALEAVSSNEPALRATALEYLGTVLPGEVQGRAHEAARRRHDDRGARRSDRASRGRRDGIYERMKTIMRTDRSALLLLVVVGRERV